MNSALGHLRRLHALYLSALVASLAVVSAAWVRPSVADLQPADINNEKYITKIVNSLLGREHLSKRKLDDEISQRTLKTFLRQLDPMKLYFTQADVNGFGELEFQLDDMARDGDVSMAYKIFNRFLERLDQRVKLVEELLGMEHDFSVDEEMITDSKQTVYAKTDDEIRDKWRKRIKYDLLVQKADKVEGEEAVTKLRRRYQSLAKRMHQIDQDELLEMYITALTSSYDPHTTYMSKSSYDNFIIMMRLELEGIGASLQYEDGYTKVKELIPGGAAEKDGRLQPEDRVIGVAQGDEGEFVDVVDMNLNDVVKLIRGTPGTVVRLKVTPAGQPEPKVYDITRARIELKDKEARAEVIEEGMKPNGQPYKIGVIDLPSFYMDMEGNRNGSKEYKSTTRDVQKILRDFRSDNVDAVMLDLRRNGGGSLVEAISLTGLFIDHGPIVQVKDSGGRIESHDDDDRGMAWDGPLVVLTSKFSASASEIFAGAIQDYRRGIVVGDKATHGKGTVQSLLDLGRQLFRNPNAPSLGALKITMQQFYRANGDSTQNRGVLADVELPSLTTHLDVGEGDLDFALKFDKIDAAEFSKETLVDPKLVEELRQLSQRRITDNDEFQKEIRRIESYKKQKEQKRVSLNAEKFLADRAELNADKEEEKKFEELNGSAPIFKRDFYNNETLAVTLDYLRLGKPATVTKR
ncbi:MAG: carboxy terminal-processing peptidase [Pirellulales bacterium]